MNTVTAPRPKPVDSASSKPTASLLSRLDRYERTPAVVAAEVGAIAGLAATAYIHLAEMSDKFAEVPYLGVGYALMSAACVVSILMIVARYKAGWYLGGATAAATIIGFVLTRTVGLPGSTDDIGNWSETIGTQALIAEGVVVAIAVLLITLHFRKGNAVPR